VATVNVQTAASTDDGGWSEAGYWSPTATIIRFGDASPTDYGRSAWFRFVTGIPALSAVASATLTLIPKGISGTPIPTLRITAAKEDAGAAPTTITDARTRTRTTAYVDWTPPSWGTGVPQASPSIASVVQEVVSRPGFSGNLLLFVEDLTTGSATLTAQLSVDSFDGVPANAASFAATYTPQAAPTATIGGPTTVATSTGITVTGTGTPNTAGATITAYTWRVVSGSGSFNNTALQNPTYTAGSTAGTATIGLTVTDSNGLTSTEATQVINITGGSGGATVTDTIAASGDDGSWHNEGAGSTSITGTTVAVGDSSSTDNARWGWTRFVLNVPQGSTITAATVSVKANGLTGTIPAMTLVAVAADDGPVYTNRAAYNALAQTSASVAWTPAAWVGGTTYTSPSLVSVVQEVVNRAGWVSGNHILLFWKVPVDAWASANVLTFRAWDGFPTEAASISVTYSGSAVPTPNAGADQGPVDSKRNINLSAAGSTGSPNVYLWRIISGGGSLSSTTVSNPTYKPPATTAGGVAVIGLRVGVGTVGSAEDTMTVTYRPHTEWIVNGAAVLTYMS
jgi:hypothetical protein